MTKTETTKTEAPAEEVPNLELGDVVLLKLSTGDAEAINRRRDDAHVRLSRFKEKDGTQMHVGTEVKKGEVVSARITRLFEDGSVNLKADLDGNDDYWASGRREGATAGMFSRK